MRIERVMNLGLPHGPDYEASGSASTVPQSERLNWMVPLQALTCTDPATRALVCKTAPHLIDTRDWTELAGAMLKELGRHLSQTLKAVRPKGGGEPTRQEKAWDRSRQKAFAMMAAIVRASYDEYVADDVCETCKGNGEVRLYEEGRGVYPETCPTCVGMGWIPWTVNKRAKAVGLDRGGKQFLEVVLPAIEHMLRWLRQKYKAEQARLTYAMFGEEE